MQTIKDTLHNDSTNIYSIEDGTQRMPVYNDADNYYFPPLLSFGDYDNSCDVERSNVRMFEQQFAEFRGIDWVKVTGAYGSESIAIKLLSTNEEIIECLEALENYPAMDDEDVSEIFSEMENEAWSNWLERDFKCAVVKNYDADDTDMEDSELWGLFREMQGQTNTNGQIESGGSYYIDIKRLINGLPEIAPEEYKLTY